MVKLFFKRTSLLLLLAMAHPTQAGIVLNVNPSSQSVNVGQIVGISIDISGLDNSNALAGYDLSLSFDPTLLQFDSAVFGDPTLGDQLDLANLGFNFPIAFQGLGSVNLIEFSLDTTSDLLNLQADQFTLATLSFTSLAGGTTPLTLALNSLADADANLLTAADTVSASVTVVRNHAVPETEALWLILLGSVLMYRNWKNSRTTVIANTENYMGGI